MYGEYDEFIAGTEIFDDINKSLDKIQKELSELITDDIDEEKKRLLTWEGQLFICCEIPLEQRDEGQLFLFPQAVYTNGVKIPDIDNFEAERLDFYKHRFEMIINVPAKIRYANYCFQYCEKNQKYKYAMQICQLLCEHLKDVTFGHECIVSFSRLFELGLSFSSDFIINKEKIVLQATEQAKHPLYKVVDFGHIEGNRKVFSTQDDDDIIKYLTFQNYGIELEVTFSTVVNFIWTKMIDMGLTAQMVISRICETEYMDEMQKEIISVGIDRFFEDDYVSALHVLVPQFESYFRTFFEWGGFPTTSLKNNGLQHEQNFNDFLRQDFVRESLDENLLFMIEFVMVEQLGKNLRNNIAHGLSDIKAFRKNNCLMVVYLFWLITAIKWVFPSESVDE